MRYIEIIATIEREIFYKQLLSLGCFLIFLITSLYAVIAFIWGTIYSIPYSAESFSIMLFGFLFGIVCLVMLVEIRRLQDKIEVFGRYAPGQEVVFQLEKILARLVAHEFKSRGHPVDFERLSTFRELEATIKKLSIDTEVRVQESAEQVTRLIHTLIESEWMSQPGLLAHYVEHGKLRQSATIALVQSIGDDLHDIERLISNSHTNSPSLIEIVLALNAVHQRIQPIIKAVEDGENPVVVTLDQARRR